MAKKDKLKSDTGPVEEPAIATFTEPTHLHKDEEQEIEYIKLADIFPSPTNPRKHFDQAKLDALAISIRKYGVIQPITLRPKKGMAGKFELVCGECRWKASGMAERLTIPSIIRDLNDDEVMDLQFAENLERQDVHSMDEAVTFKAMIDTGRYTVPDIAAKVLKSEAFVVHRISLNSLIPEFQEHFWAGKFLIGHAVQFSRLNEADQKELYKRFGRADEYSSLKDVRNYIDTNINRKLSSAPFKKDDAQLVPAAGACVACGKRSGSNGTLFSDYKDDDRCFDQTCFEKKMATFLIKKVQTTIESNPEILLVERSHYGEKVNPAIKKLATGMKVDIIDSSSGKIQSNQERGYVPVKVLMVNGNSAGKVETMYVKGKAKPAGKDGKPAKRTVRDIEEEIKGVEDRQERAMELDAEKQWTAIEELLEDPAALKSVPWTSEPTQEEKNAMAYAIMEHIEGDEYETASAKVMKLKAESYCGMDIEEAKKIKGTSSAQLFHLLRLLILSTLKDGLSPITAGGPFILMPVIKMPKYLLTDIMAIQKEHKETIEKRIASAAKRVKALKEEKKLLEAPKEKKADGPKKAGKAKPALTSKDVKGKKASAPAPAARKNHLGQELTDYGLDGSRIQLPGDEDEDEAIEA